MLCQPGQQNNFYSIVTKEEKEDCSRNVQIKISAKSSTCPDDIIQKQSLLIQKLKEERGKLIENVGDKNKIINQMINQMKEYEIQIISSFQRNSTAATNDKQMSEATSLEANEMKGKDINENEELIASIESLELEIVSLNKEIKENQRKFEKEKQELIQLNEKFMRETMAQKNNKWQQMIKQQKQRQRQIAEKLRIELKQEKKKKGQLQKNEQSLNKQITKLKKKVQKFKKIKNENKKSVNEIEVLENDEQVQFFHEVQCQAELQSKNDCNEQKIRNLQQRISDFMMDLSFKNAYIRDLEAETNFLKKDTVCFKQEIEKKTISQQNGFKASEEQNKQKIKNIQIEAQILRSDLETKKQEINKLIQQVKIQTKKIEELRNQNEQLEEKVSIQSQKITELIRQSSQKQKILKETKKSMAKTTTEKEKAEEQLKQQTLKNNSLVKISEEHEKCSKIIKELLDENAGIKSSLEQKKEKIKSLEEVIEKLNKNIEELRNESDEVIKLFGIDENQNMGQGQGQDLKENEQNREELAEKLRIANENLKENEQKLLTSQKSFKTLREMVKKLFQSFSYLDYDEDDIFDHEKIPQICDKFLKYTQRKAMTEFSLQKATEEEQNNDINSSESEQKLKPKNKNLCVVERLEIKRSYDPIHSSEFSPEVRTQKVPMAYVEGENKEGKGKLDQRFPSLDESKINIYIEESQFPQGSHYQKDEKIQFPMIICKNPVSQLYKNENYEIKPFLARTQPYQSELCEETKIMMLKELKKSKILEQIQKSSSKLVQLTVNLENLDNIDDKNLKEIAAILPHQDFLYLLKTD